MGFTVLDEKAVQVYLDALTLEQGSTGIATSSSAMDTDEVPIVDPDA
eukprot:NODE_6928_length_215_cov_94.584337_g6483_i0.p1 GENE.NODE_6928_length_215_cov_94.584337_g6483_i0~~NODE_6928_length_215_cov_94.584337_g6483_i0.p1  ORF type:complete len:55 (+),score=5.93 NODE_6928_length_215_cov_94.584337_g6483_i0:27-167(+)